MSERTSPISPRSPQIFADADRRSEELFAFEGVDALVQAWRDGLTPIPRSPSRNGRIGTGS